MAGRDIFVSQSLRPRTATCDSAQMATGAPGLPAEFVWNTETVQVRSLVRSWRETGKCTHGSGENYLRKHWFEVETSHGTMQIYFERKPRGGPRSARWWLFSLREPLPRPSQSAP